MVWESNILINGDKFGLNITYMKDAREMMNVKNFKYLGAMLTENVTRKKDILIRLTT